MSASSPKRQLLLADYPVLEDRLVHDIRERKADDPFAAVRVLVPTALLRRHLRRVLTERLGGHLGVEFLTLDEVVGETATPALEEGERPLPLLESGLGPALVLEGVVREQAEERGFYFAPIADKPGFHRALGGTIADLEEGRVSVDDLDYAINHGAVDRHVNSRKLVDLLGIWRGYRGRLKEAKFVDSAGLAVASIVRLAGTQPPPGLTVVYGLYDLNELQKLLVLTWCGESDTLVLFPRDAGPAFGWTDDLAAWFGASGFAPEHFAYAGTSRRSPELQHHAARLFATPDGDAAPSDGSVQIVAAPDEAREAREIAREVLRAVRADETLRFSDFAVVPRSADAYRGVLTEAFAAAGIPLNVVQPPPLAESPAGRAALLLLDIVQRDFPRAKVMELATGFDLAAGEEAAPELWDLLTLKAGIVGRAEEWRKQLPALQREAARLEKRHDEDDDTPAPPNEAHLQAAGQAQVFVRSLLQFGDELRGITRFADGSRVLVACLGRLLARTDDLGRVVTALQSLAALDELSAETDFATFARAVERLLSSAPDRAEDANAEGVVFADIMALRGTSFRVVFVPGLVEKSFPLPARQDPLLLDYDRRRLNDVLAGVGTGGMLPEKQTRVEEEKLLYRLACGLATERLVLSYPRLEAGTGRERVPSHFLLRTVEALTGKRATTDDLKEHPAYRRVPVSQFAPVDATQSVDELDFDLGSVLRAVQSRHADSAIYLRNLNPHFARGLTAEWNRWGRRKGEDSRLTAWDGMLESADALSALLAGHTLEHDTVSPSALETLGKCPYRYLLARVLGLQVLEEPERLHTLAPQDRGELIHDILEDFTRALTTRGEWPPDEESLGELDRRAREWFHWAENGGKKPRDEDGKVWDRMTTGFRLFWELEQQRILEDLAEWRQQEVETSAGWRPTLLESKYGYEDSAPPTTLVLDDDRQLRFRGRIDRVDLDAAGEHARVLDYKTGGKYGAKDDSLQGGASLQLPLYLIAAEELLASQGRQAKPDHAFFWYVTRKEKFARVTFGTVDWAERLADLKHILCTFSDCVRAGRFFPVPDEQRKCRYCDFALICGAGKEEVFERKRSDPKAEKYLALQEIP